MKATLYINTKDTISPIDDRIYSSFIEHMGRAIWKSLQIPPMPDRQYV